MDNETPFVISHKQSVSKVGKHSCKNFSNNVGQRIGLDVGLLHSLRSQNSQKTSRWLVTEQALVIFTPIIRLFSRRNANGLFSGFVVVGPLGQRRFFKAVSRKMARLVALKTSHGQPKRDEQKNRGNM